MQYLQWIEQARLSTWVREAHVLYAYPLVLALHTIGMGTLVGVSIFISLRILGIAPGLPLAELETLLPVLWVGFAINAATGVLLLMADATGKLTNPVFYVKMLCIFFAITLLVKTKNTTLRGPDDAISATGRLMAAASIFLWASAITAGRLMAYIGQTAP